MSHPLRDVKAEDINSDESAKGFSPLLPSEVSKRCYSEAFGTSDWKHEVVMDEAITEDVKNPFTYIKPMQFDFQERQELDEKWGWKTLIHPDGRPYYYFDYTDQAGFTWQYVTDSDPKSKHHYKRHHEEVKMETLKQIKNLHMQLTGNLDDFPESTRITLPKKFQIVMDGGHMTSGSHHPGYYMVNNEKKSIFWLEKADITLAIDKLHSRDHKPHLEHYMEYEYWKHCRLYPHGRCVDTHDLETLDIILRQRAFDALLIPNAVRGFNAEDLNKIIDLVGDMRRRLDKNAKESRNIVGEKEAMFMTAEISAFMSGFAHERYATYHGHPRAHLSSSEPLLVERERRDMLVQEDQQRGPHTVFMSSISPALFYAPVSHLERLHLCWVGNRLVSQEWDKYCSMVRDEWREFMLYATILLPANLGFLAIPIVAGNDDLSSFSQIVSYVSIIESFSTIIIGLLLERQYREKGKDSRWRMAWYFGTKTYSRAELEGLAMLHSVPYALLMWGVVSFLAAVAVAGYQSATRTGKGVIIAAWVMLIILAIVTALVSFTFKFALLRLQRRLGRYLRKGVRFIMKGDHLHPDWQKHVSATGRHYYCKMEDGQPVHWSLHKPLYLGSWGSKSRKGNVVKDLDELTV